ncbi:SDR family NAD(P)-dependent oxidoreductase [Telmatospirillum siberiense]|uniref:Short-chain dehydrogenase n=1 Tax=Telmatospirillum siberiense TaxID=382514 RepID=A0A2N3Q083_9PROT|nr:SDR family NAD(P)-dependent oxidoreductase [Telmatospirillum siberiense]PKU26064.1 short-chain dehydrogenase [Telmatospirillum siberiense]
MTRRNVLITGASSGLGRALALAYAKDGGYLFLSGRDGPRLGEVADACRILGAQASTALIDVTDAGRMAEWITRSDGTAPLDLVIANAGISAGTGTTGDETAEQTRRIFKVNFDGVINTVLPAIDAMRPRRTGQIALMASLAGFRGMPTAPAYCASKAAVRIWGEGMRGVLARDGIGLTVICPGFVETPMTAVNRFPMPFLMSAEKAGQLMRRGIDANRARLAYPWPMALVIWMMSILPPGWTDPFLARLPAKS